MSNGPSDLAFRCTTCLHPQVSEINSELAKGYAQAAVAITYGIPIQSLNRHWREHVLHGGDMEGQGELLITLRDVLDIPVQMRERGQIVRSLIDLCLEPLTRKPTKAKPAGLNAVPQAFLATLFRVQMHDEETLMKITGVMQEAVVDSSAGAVLSSQYNQIQHAIEDRLAELSNGDAAVAAQARLLLAEMLVPMDEIESTYRDLGAIEGKKAAGGRGR